MHQQSPRVVTVVMAGGLGTRFWPLSLPERPKQFLDILGTGQSLLQASIERALQLSKPEDILVVTSEAHLPLTREQLPMLPARNLYGEPHRRNTAPCIALAVSRLIYEAPEAVMVVVPSDHHLPDPEAYLASLRQAVRYASTRDELLTLGIRPDRPATEYGYIEQGEPAEGQSTNGIHHALRFREKPELKTAKGYLQQGTFLWNSGIFVSRVESMHRAIHKHCPHYLEAFKNLPWGREEDARFAEAFEKEYRDITPLSIDYALFEKAENVSVLPVSFPWSDLGGWDALHALLPKDSNGNASFGGGTATFTDSHHCLALAPQGVELRVENQRDCVVIFHEGRIMVRQKA